MSQQPTQRKFSRRKALAGIGASGLIFAPHTAEAAFQETPAPAQSKPLDADLIAEYSERTGRVVTVEENVLQGGFGSAVLEALEDRGLLSKGGGQVEILRLGLPDAFVEHGPQDVLLRLTGIDAASIVAGVLRLVRPEIPAVESIATDSGASQ